MIATEALQSVPTMVKATVTRLQDYAYCPAYYQRRHLLKLPGYVTPAMQAGRDVHALSQDFLEGKPLGPVDPDLAEAFDALKLALQDPTGVEQALFAQWDDQDLHVTFEGRLDWYQLQGDTVRIIDLKSGFGIIGVKDLSVDLQAKTYAWLAFREFPWVTRVRFEQAQLRYHGRMLGTDFSREQAEQFFVSELQPKVRRMAQDTAFLPNPMCDRCPPGAHLTALDPYRQVRVQVRDGGHFDVSFDPIATDQEFQSAAFGWLLASRIGAALKQRMDAYTDANGPKPVTDDEAYGPWLQPERICSSVEAAIAIFQAHGVPLQEVLRLDLTRCKKYLDGRRAIPELQALMVEVPATRHGLRKVSLPTPINNASDSTGVTVAFPPSSPAVPPATPEPGSTISAPAPSSLTADEAAGGPLTPPRVDSSPTSSSLNTHHRMRRTTDRSSQPTIPVPNLPEQMPSERGLVKGEEVPIGTAGTDQAGVERTERTDRTPAPARHQDWNVASVILRLRQAARKSKARTARNALPTLALHYTDRWALVKAIFPEATIMAELSPGQAAALVEWSQTAGFDKEAALVEGSL